MIIGTLPPGSLGFDCNTNVAPSIAAKFVQAGFKFVVRYVRRSTRHEYDLNVQELIGCLQAGLGVGVVQHVAAEGWTPTERLGAGYGAIAAEEARLVGIPPEVTLWCDLEGVAVGTPRQQVIDFCNAWYAKAKEAGYSPGLYVGYDPGLSAHDLYYKLRFQRYWSAYNLNKDQFPVKRDVQMKQGPYPPKDQRVPGVPFQYDTDVIDPDNFGDTPVFVLPK